MDKVYSVIVIDTLVVALGKSAPFIAQALCPNFPSAPFQESINGLFFTVWTVSLNCLSGQILSVNILSPLYTIISL